MFDYQDSVTHKNKYLDLYEEWKKTNEPTMRKNDYLDTL